MKLHPLHSWDVPREEAPALQRELASRVDIRTPLAGYELVAGADVSYNRFATTFYAAVVVLRSSDWSVVEVQGAVRESTFPYIPGLLSFREAPALLDAFVKVRAQPDVIMIEAHGVAHPRRFGITSHVGLWLDLPTVGAAKSLLYGRCKEPGKKVGSLSPIVAGDEVIGMAVRTKLRTKPVYVSVGHRIDLPSAVRVVLASCRGYRLPEPTRQAHLHCNSLRRRSG
jgi:deoxyribonuclease V